MFPLHIHRFLFLFGLYSLAVGMLLGAVPTSVPQCILLGNWLLEGRFKEKLTQLKNNKLFWIITSLFFLHLMGLIYTEDFSRGLDDLKTKVPLLLLPIVLFSTPIISEKEFKRLSFLFLLCVVVSSVLCTLVYRGYYPQKKIIDIRDASIYISHIRYSLFIVLAISWLLYTLLNKNLFYIKGVCLLVIIWLIYFLVTMQMATGLAILGVLMAVYGVYFLFYIKSKSIKGLVVFSLIGILSFVTYLFYKEAKKQNTVNPFPANQILEKTVNGGPYFHDTTYKVTENGNYVGLNINYYELEPAWNKRSTIKFTEKDKKGNNVYSTLLRYLASKGYTKDSLGLSLLNAKDIENIEWGLTNYLYTDTKGSRSRIRDLVWEYNTYRRQENPSGHSLRMRLEFWKTASQIIKEHPIIGVGTGDAQKAFNAMYEKQQTKLHKKWWLRSHNQYLAILICFGLVGLVLFLISVFYPVFILRKSVHGLYYVFLLIACLSFITEDTLETQSGATFYAFFNTLFLWMGINKQNNTRKPNL